MANNVLGMIFSDLLSVYGIPAQFTTLCNTIQDGVVERRNRSLFENLFDDELCIFAISPKESESGY